MLRAGLTSVTFRNLDFYEIIKYCKECNISAIEWGSDVHAPIDDEENALKIKTECDKAEILVSSYGTYYKCGKYEDSEKEFLKYIKIAKILGAPTMRIWVGEKNYEEANAEYIERIVSELKMICDLAKKENIQIGCELHGGTLCNNRENSLEIVKRVDKDNFGMYFQYDWNFSVDDNCKTLESFLPMLKNVHVFNIVREDSGIKRLSVGEEKGKEMWKRFAGILKANKVNATLLFEFLADPTKDYLKNEAMVLNDIIKNS